MFLFIQTKKVVTVNDLAQGLPYSLLGVTCYTLNGYVGYLDYRQSEYGCILEFKMGRWTVGERARAGQLVTRADYKAIWTIGKPYAHKAIDLYFIHLSTDKITEGIARMQNLLAQFGPLKHMTYQFSDTVSFKTFTKGLYAIDRSPRDSSYCAAILAQSPHIRKHTVSQNDVTFLLTPKALNNQLPSLEEIARQLK